MKLLGVVFATDTRKIQEHHFADHCKVPDLQSFALNIFLQNEH